MKGIVFNLLEECVEKDFGADTWDALLESAGLEGAYTALGNYPDEEALKIVGAACAALQKPADEILRWFGSSALPLLAQRYSHFFEPHHDTITFLKTLNDVIHPEVRKLYPGAQAPDFEFEEPGEKELLIQYTSPRNLVAFGEGLIQGATTHYGESVEISSKQVSDTSYTIHCRFA